MVRTAVINCAYCIRLRARPLDGAALKMSTRIVASAAMQLHDAIRWSVFRNAIYLPKFHYVFVLSTLAAALIGGVVFATQIALSFAELIYFQRSPEQKKEHLKCETRTRNTSSHMIRGGNEFHFQDTRNGQSNGSSWMKRKENVCRTNSFSLFAFAILLNEGLAFATNWATFFLCRSQKLICMCRNRPTWICREERKNQKLMDVARTQQWNIFCAALVRATEPITLRTTQWTDFVFGYRWLAMLRRTRCDCGSSIQTHHDQMYFRICFFPVSATPFPRARIPMNRLKLSSNKMFQK